MKKNVALLIALLLLMTGGSPAMAAKPMPKFSLPSAADNKEVSSEAFKGKVLLVTFFATWCPPCRQEVPNFIQLQQELADKGFSIVAFSVDEGGASIVKKLIEHENINYPVLMADKRVMEGFGGISGIPVSFLVNSNGNVVKNYPGYIPHALLKSDIEELLKERD